MKTAASSSWPVLEEVRGLVGGLGGTAIPISSQGLGAALRFQPLNSQRLTADLPTGGGVHLRDKVVQTELSVWTPLPCPPGNGRCSALPLENVLAPSEAALDG